MGNAGRFDSFENDGSMARVSLFPDLRITTIGIEFENQARSEGFHFIAGVDEVGRGCLAGPVVAAACILDLDKRLPKGLDDSKKLSEKRRNEIAEQLKQDCVAYAIGRIEADEIDRINRRELIHDLRPLIKTIEQRRKREEAMQPKQEKKGRRIVGEGNDVRVE